MEEKTNTQKKTEQKRGKVFRGTVVSDKMRDTAVVSVARYVKHPKFGKYMKRMKKYHAHDPGNAHKTGEKVEIKETRPISKKKHFQVI